MVSAAQAVVDLAMVHDLTDGCRRYKVAELTDGLQPRAQANVYIPVHIPVTSIHSPQISVYCRTSINSTAFMYRMKRLCIIHAPISMFLRHYAT